MPLSALLVMAATLAQSPQSSDPVVTIKKVDPIPLETRLVSWKSGLQHSFKGVIGNVVIDLGASELATFPPRAEMSDSISESDFARLMSAQLQRKLTTLPDGWLMTRQGGYSVTEKLQTAKSWLTSVSDGELKKLCSTGVAYADLSQDTKDLFARLCSNPGLQQKMASGEFAGASVRMAIYATGYDAKGKSVTVSLTAASKSSAYEKGLRAKLEQGYHKPSPTQSTVRPPTGDCDLSKGDVMSLEAIAALINSRFKKSVHFDPRLARSYYYIQGRFTESSLMAFLREVTKALPTDYDEDSAVSKKELDRLLRQRVAKLVDSDAAPKGVSYDDALAQKSYTAKDLAALFPGLDSGLSQRQISMDSVLTLSAGLSLQLVGDGSFLEPDAPPGTSPLANSWGISFRSVN